MIGGAAFGSVGFAQMAPSQPLAIDRTANGFHGVYIGSPAPSRSGVFTGEYAPQFDGVDDAVIVADAAALDFTTALTLEAFVYSTALNHANGGNNPRILSKVGYGMWVNSAAQLGFGTVGTTPTSVTSTTYTLPLNAWTHVVVVWTGSVVRFFKNGLQIGADVAYTGTIPNHSQALLIGDFNNSATERHWAGGLAHVAVYNTALSAARIAAHAAAGSASAYAAAVMADAPVGYWPLTERLPAPVTEDAWALAPIRFAINSVLRADDIRMDALQIEGTLGQPMVCDFTLVNPSTKPRPGDRVLARYYDETLFSGLIDRIEQKPNQNMSVIDYLCTCTDWSILLTRRRLRRNFTNLPILNIVDSILDNELAGDGLSIGTIDIRTTIPLVDVRNARAFDVLRDMAGATGQAMYVDFNKAIQFRTSTNEPAPKVLDDTTVEASSLVEDMETYRNVQTVIVTGTAPQGTDANVVPVELTNEDQIAARQAIEGGTGRVEDIEEITHPTSNAGADLALLGLGYARLRLATSGTPRKTLRARVRGYGFREGQFASVNLTGVAVTGTWLIQRVTFRERTARSLVYDLELTQSSQQQRAYEAWLSIVQTGKVVVQMPGSITNNLEAFNAPGTTTWIVPAGVLQLTITAIGASGGGGGGALALAFFADEHQDAHGGDGGNGGRAVTTIDVAEGDEIGVTIGAAGIAGTGSTVFAGQTSGTAGTAATVTRVTRNGITVCQADGGTGGGGGYANTDTALVTTHGADGIDGSGLGDAVTVGGGKNGGAGGTSGGNGAHGSDGSVSIAY